MRLWPANKPSLPRVTAPCPAHDGRDRRTAGHQRFYVSRAVDDKWAGRRACCVAGFLRWWIGRSSGRPVAYETVKKKFKLWLGLKTGRPLSDAAIEKALQEEGIDIKRRTVASTGKNGHPKFRVEGSLD